MLKGQWVGPFAGTNSGEMIIELDELGGQLVGTATVYPSDQNLPSTFVQVGFPIGQDSLEQQVQVFPIDWVTGDPVVWQQIASRYPGVIMPTFANSTWALSGKILYVSWVTDVDSHGLGVLTQGSPNEPSQLTPLPIANWAEFKNYASALEAYRYIFRGQSDSSWRIRTHFHRTGRSDLRRFIKDDVSILHRNLSGLTAHFFNLANPIENAAFYTLVQHHGYPTPLLDWTFSPYVAAYFAYRNLPKDKRTDEHKVRIIVFDATQWRNDFPQLQKIIPATRHFSLLAPLGINNTRLVPQQALMTVSNVDDIEGYIEERETHRNKTYLQVIDLPGSQRQVVMRELSMMGITAGSLFPGLDGACEQLREQYFEL
jgi:hypothetical protein